jgi:hypothetical protein
LDFTIAPILERSESTVNVLQTLDLKKQYCKGEQHPALRRPDRKAAVPDEHFMTSKEHFVTRALKPYAPPDKIISVRVLFCARTSRRNEL